MAQKPKLRTHTHMDISLVKEMQHVVDRVLVPNCIRKTQAFYLGIGVLCLGIGAGSVLASGQLVVGAIFGLLGLAMLGWGAMAYHIAARKTYRQMEKAVRLVETEKNVYCVTRQGDTLVLSKENLKGGTMEELRLWLTEHCRLPIVVLDSHWKVIERVESNQKKENPQ